MNQMDEDHRRDYAAKQLYDEARRALGAIAADDRAWDRLGLDDQRKLRDVVERLKARADHIVAVWD